MKNIVIKDACPENSYLIADAILCAIGEEITNNLAGKRSRDEVRQLFARLAQNEHSQYSYKNTRIAFSEEGIPMGVCISYEGSDLKRLRRQFFKEANKYLNWNITEEEVENLPDETTPDEFYLDTLTTLPKFRGRGVGRSLILDALDKATRHNKPLGLLCDIDNTSARRLYDSLGFKEMGTRPFAGHEMYHLLLVPHSF